MTWLEFIIDNFIPGTATDIAIHIEKMVKEKKFITKSNSIRYTVFKLLPKHTEGRIREGSKRKQGAILFRYNDLNSHYSLLNDDNNDLKTTLVFNNTRKGLKNIRDGKVHFTRDTDQSKSHTRMLDVIEAYINSSGIQSWDIECDGIDVMYKTGRSIELLEVKSYKEGVFKGVGQLEYYKYQLQNKYDIEKEINLSIVGNFNLPEKYIGYLKNLNIKYKNISEFIK